MTTNGTVVSGENALNPVQQRVVEQLFVGGGQPADPEIGPRLRAHLEERLAPAAANLPEAGDLFLNKTALDALGCDGRYLDHLATPFEWRAPMVVGQLAHAAVRLDFVGDYRRSPRELVDHAWAELAARPRGAGEFLATLGGAEADALRADARDKLVSFREQFPPLSEDWTPRFDEKLDVRLCGDRIVLRGVPDLLLGRIDPRYRRMLVVDLKTGGRNPLAHRSDMRLYALLVTLKYGVAPYRAATYYLDAADWDHEDIDEDGLAATAERIGQLAARAVVLHHDPPAEEDLRLNPGPPCRWCGRAETCPVADPTAA